MQDELSSPISAQLFDLCDPELFADTLASSEVASSSNCCYEDNSSYPTNLPFPSDISFPTTTNATTTNAATNQTSNLSSLLEGSEEVDADITASIDFQSSPPFGVPQFLKTQQDQFDFSSVQLQPQEEVTDGFSQYPQEPVLPLTGPPNLQTVFEEDCLSNSVPSFLRFNPSPAPCSFLDSSVGQFLPANMGAALSAESSGFFTGALLMASELQPQEMELRADNGGLFFPETMQRVFNPAELQAISTESQHLVNGTGTPTPLASEISSMDESTFKVGKLSTEQRKEKIHRYLKKRNQRNFSKKIKYACRKTLADSRPRVRGRFAKNDDFGDTHRTNCSNHEDDDDEDVMTKEEEDLVESSDIFAHISGVNSFKCNYPIQSWIN